jgi:hypothetical protein
MVNGLAKRLYYLFIPFALRVKIGRFNRREAVNLSKTRFVRQEEYFKGHLDEFMFDDARKADILKIFSLLKKNGAATFPEMGILKCEKYFARELNIEKDLDADLFYVLIDNKKLFFKNGMDKPAVHRSFSSMSFEQDYASPHRYLTNDHYFVGVIPSKNKHVNDKLDSFGVVEGDIVVDAGVAEGNFALSIVEKASKVYIIENDAAWCEALRHTFLPYKEKVEIIQKCLSDVSDDDCITLNDLIETYHIPKIDFLKMDIEGYEMKALHGATTTDGGRFVNINKMAICTYHNLEDELKISNFISQYGYKFYLTNGYMVLSDSSEMPIRKAILRAYK